MALSERWRRILVGVDGSPASVAALARAVRVARALDMPVEAVIVWRSSVVFRSRHLRPGWSPEDDGRRTLAGAVAVAFPDGPPDNLTQTVLEGHAAHVLIEKSKSAFMLVVGSHSHHGAALELLGSVSTACAEGAQCPVLVVPTSAEAAGGSPPLVVPR